MLFAVLMLTMLDVCAKSLSETLPISQISWARYFGHLIIMLIILWPKKGFTLFQTNNLKLQILRSILLVLCTILFFAAISYMPLADAVAISFVSPLIVTALSVPLLGEHVGRRRWAAVLIGFVGTIIIIRPGAGVMHWAAFLIIIMAVAFALFQITTRMLSTKDNLTTTLFYSAFIGTLALSAAVPFQWKPISGGTEWLLFASLGFWAVIGHFALIRAHQLAPVAVLAPLMYLGLPWNTLWGYILFNDLPDRWTIVGAMILVATGIYILYREGLHDRLKP